MLSLKSIMQYNLMSRMRPSINTKWGPIAAVADRIAFALATLSCII